MYSPIPAKVPVKTTFLLDFVNFFFIMSHLCSTILNEENRCDNLLLNRCLSAKFSVTNYHIHKT